MRALRRTSWIAVLVTGAAVAASPPLEVEIPPGEWTVGDPIEVTLRLRLPPDHREVVPRFPLWSERWGDAELLAVEAPRRDTGADGATVWSQRLTLVAFRPGAIPLPRRQVALPLEAETLRIETPADLHLEIASVLPESVPRENLEIRPPAALHALPLGAAFWWTLAIASVLLAAALTWAWWRPAVEPIKEETAWISAGDELDVALRRLASETEMLPFHAGLSQAMRRYLGRVLAFPALESTTREIRRRLAACRLPGQTARTATELLAQCDRVKFARRGADHAPERLLVQARELAALVEAHVWQPVADEEEAA